MSRSLQFDIVANDKATGTLKGVQGAASNFAKSIGGMVTGLFALQAVLSRVMSFGQQSFAWAAGLGEAAAGIGITTAELQQLQYAATQSGVEVGKLQKAFLDLRKTLRDAQGGNQQAIAVMAALGYTQEQVAKGNISAMDAFLRVSGAISAATTEQEKFNIATALFGDKVATDMIRVLGNVETLKKNISDTPLITDAEIDKFDKLDDKVNKFYSNARVFFARAGFAIGQSLTTFGEVKRAPTAEAPKAEPTAQEKAAAAALGKLGRPASAGKSAGAIAGGGSEQFTALQQIGGAAGFMMGGRGKSEELSALEKIEENTRPGGTVPANGSTNFTNAGVSDAEYSSFVRVAQGARFSPRRRDRAPR